MKEKQKGNNLTNLVEHLTYNYKILNLSLMFIDFHYLN